MATDRYRVIHGKSLAPVIGQGISPATEQGAMDLCEKVWREKCPASSSGAKVYWQDGRMWFEYGLPDTRRKLSREAEFQIERVEEGDEGPFEIVDTVKNEVITLAPTRSSGRKACEEFWRAWAGERMRYSSVSWQDDEMYFVYNAMPPVRANIQMRRQTVDLVAGAYEVFITRVADGADEILLSDVPHITARAECERLWRQMYSRGLPEAKLTWQGAELHYTTPMSIPGTSRTERASIQIRPMKKDETGARMFEVVFPSRLGLRTYTFDVFGDRMHAAVWGMINEFNKQQADLAWMQTQNRQDALEGEARQNHLYATYMTAGKVDGLREAIEELLLVLGMQR